MMITSFPVWPQGASFKSGLNEFGGVESLGNGQLQHTCFPIGSAQYWFMYAPVGKMVEPASIAGGEDGWGEHEALVCLSTTICMG